MKPAEELEREIKVLRERLARFVEVSLRINDSLDFNTVLQGILDSARSLTAAFQLARGTPSGPDVSAR